MDPLLETQLLGNCAFQNMPTQIKNAMEDSLKILSIQISLTIPNKITSNLQVTLKMMVVLRLNNGKSGVFNLKIKTFSPIRKNRDIMMGQDGFKNTLLAQSWIFEFIYFQQLIYICNFRRI
jgi:hypothetical protein